MCDSSSWFRAARWHVIAGFVLVTFTSLAGAVNRAQAVPPDGYVLQRANVTFDVDVSHAPLKMRFGRVDAQLEATAAGIESGQVTVTIDAASVETRPRFLSSIVRGSGMLDVARYPEIRFVSTRFVRNGEGGGWLYGDLTMHGVMRPVSFQVTESNVAGSAPRAGLLAFSATGEVSRREFGVSAWFPAVSDAVHVNIEVEFAQGP